MWGAGLILNLAFKTVPSGEKKSREQLATTDPEGQSTMEHTGREL
jgi:hypothetical protein